MTIQRPASPLVSVTELLDLRPQFYVADYQRGYKWTALEIEQLLEDLRTFRCTASGDFYCLQPLAVAWSQERKNWELIDGQQRLTTLFLILKFLKIEPFALTYATRSGSAEFLKNIASRDIAVDSSWQNYIKRESAEDNIDNYHFFEGYKTIANWFAKIGTERAAVIETLRNRARFIWHEVTGSDFRSVFLHLNSGKIPLTEAELIKAHFLRTSATEGESAKLRREEMAQDWDRIEYALRNDAFWFFLKGAAAAVPEPTRITFIFELIVPADKHAAAAHPLFSHYATMRQFSAKDEWEKVKGCFHTLEDWFEDRNDYHLVGFLCARVENWSFRELLKFSRDQTKTKLQHDLRCQVNALVDVTEKDLLSLSYNEKEDYRKITDILLLANILNLPDSARFPFDLYHRESWSLEHIHARNPEPLRSQDEWSNWSRDVSRELDREGLDAERAANLKAEIAAWLDSEATNNKEAQREILDAKVARFTEPELNDEEIHSLRNLALLSGPINSALNNSHFEAKRKLLIEKDRQGHFIPIVTKNAFLKYYEGDTTCMNQWSPKDRDGYFAHIEDTLKKFCHE